MLQLLPLFIIIVIFLMNWQFFVKEGGGRDFCLLFLPRYETQLNAYS